QLYWHFTLTRPSHLSLHDALPISCSKVGCTPATSNDTSAPPPKISRTVATASSTSLGFTTSVAPIANAFSKRTADRSTATILVAPAALAAAATNTPIGPAPKMATFSPNFKPPSLTACTATAVG